jgi:hypothetical protein
MFSNLKFGALGLVIVQTCMAASSMQSTIGDFKLGIQVADDKLSGAQAGEARYTRWASDKQEWTEWATDNDSHDPDAFRIAIEANTKEASLVLKDKDIRLGVQLTDGDGDPGAVQWTPWASEGGGWVTGWAVDSDGYDPDKVRIIIETRDKAGLVIKDVQVGIKLADNGGRSGEGNSRYTKWLREEGGGWSEWAGDSDGYDPDAIKLCLNVRIPQ